LKKTRKKKHTRRKEWRFWSATVQPLCAYMRFFGVREIIKKKRKANRRPKKEMGELR